MNILHVEDDPMVAKAVYRHLAGPHDVFQAATISEFETMWRAQEFDLVITDLELPGGTGFDIIERAQEDEVPCLVFSGATDKEEEVARTGVPFIDKLDIRELMKCVDAVASKR